MTEMKGITIKAKELLNHATQIEHDNNENVALDIF